MPVTLAIQTRSDIQPSVLVRPLVLWHLLSLDAPTVAVVWTAAAARAVGARTGTSLLAMFLAVWMLYAVDRLLDSSAGAVAELEARHRFHQRHRRVLRWLLALAAIALAAMLPHLPAGVLRGELPVAALLLGWLLLVHLPPRRRDAPRRRLPKELGLGLFFAAAVFTPAAVLEPAARSRLLPAAVCFAALCSLNCLYIYLWEHRSPATRASAHPSTRWALGHLPAVTFLLILLPWMLAVRWHSGLLAAEGLAAALLLLLDRFPPRDSIVLRACADAALLTPLLLMW